MKKLLAVLAVLVVGCVNGTPTEPVRICPDEPADTVGSFPAQDTVRACYELAIKTTIKG